jgi:hypothetical protein
MRKRLTGAVLLGVLLPAGFVKAAATHAQDADARAVHKNVVSGMHGSPTDHRAGGDGARA